MLLRLPSLSAALCCLGMALPAGGQTTVDDFESYQDGQIIGPAADSSPWCRFGNATVDNVSATAHPDKVLEGFGSAQYVVRWPATFGSARYTYAQPTDLTAKPQLSLTLRSTQDGAGTLVRFAFDAGDTGYLSKKTWPLTDQPQTISEELTADRFERVTGTGTFADALKNVHRLGFNLSNPQTTQGELTQVIVFDSLRVGNTAPAPTEPQ